MNAIKVKELHFSAVEFGCWTVFDEEINAIALANEFEDGARAILYCYVKPRGCIAFEIVGKTRGEKTEIFEDEKPRKIYFDTLIDCELVPFDTGALRDKIEAKAKQIFSVEYEPYQNLVATRAIDEIDHLRQQFYPDVITVYDLQNEQSPKFRLGAISRMSEQGVLLVRAMDEGGDFSDEESAVRFFTAENNGKTELVAVIK